MKMGCLSSSHPQNSIIKVDESLTQLSGSCELMPLSHKRGARHYCTTAGDLVATKT